MLNSIGTKGSDVGQQLPNINKATGIRSDHFALRRVREWDTGILVAYGDMRNNVKHIRIIFGHQLCKDFIYRKTYKVKYVVSDMIENCKNRNA